MKTTDASTNEHQTEECGYGKSQTTSDKPMERLAYALHDYNSISPLIGKKISMISSGAATSAGLGIRSYRTPSSVEDS